MEHGAEHENDRQHPNQIPDGGIDDDESAATEVAEAPHDAAAAPESGEWDAIIDALWAEYDADGSGFLDRQEIVPLAQAALSQVGYKETLD